MKRCCAWRPDPVVFGPCPHCKDEPPQSVRTFRQMFTRYSAFVYSDMPTRFDLTLAD